MPSSSWVPNWLESGFLDGGAEQTGMTDLTWTAGAMKLARGTSLLGFTDPGLAEHTGMAVLIVTGAASDGTRGLNASALGPDDRIGTAVLAVTGAAITGSLNPLGRLGELLDDG